MKKYEVVESVRQTVIRERRWFVHAISEQDAIRQIVEKEATEGYAGEKFRLESSEASRWRVDGEPVEYRRSEAVPEDDDLVDTGGGD